ncbi:lysosome membrane protein 2-like [Littorina saxatilis]|uniref:Lysosome membrane protein 2 n=1 Tax=Littorina saxatilis TaxID=31220 RepID=A0AAN9B1K2_9CAEN
MSRKVKLCALASCGMFGVVVIILGIAMVPPVSDNYMHSKVDESLPLQNGTEAYSKWMSPPMPVLYQIWVQDVINPMEVVTTDAKPVLIQRGPYTYREKREKVDVRYTSKGTITYREKVWFHFARNLSVGPDTDTLTTINVPILTLATLLKSEYHRIPEAEKLVFEELGEHLFLNLTVNQLLWGYEDKLLNGITALLRKHHVQLPFDDDKFGLFKTTNGTDAGVFEIYTGVDSVDNFAYIASWNCSRSLNYWTSDKANMINGSDGNRYPPFVDTSKSYYLFSSQLCRSLELSYLKSSELKDIDLARFTIPHRVLDDVNHNPDNRGFCTPKNSCLPAGLINASICQGGTPLVFSLPHFLDGDPEVRSRVMGMHPRRDEHEFIIDIEPITGMVMRHALRLQVNVYVHNISHIRETGNLKKPIFLPLFWFNETTEVDNQTAKEFRDNVQEPMNIFKTLKFGAPVLGSVILAISMLAFFTNKNKKDRSNSETTPFYDGPIY